MADIPLSNALSSGQRRAVYVLTSSNASFPIPAWAQGGKGVVYVTGCGGGAGGNVRVASAQRGGGGGGGARANRLPIPIPSGVTTIAAVIGAAGNGGSGAASTDGTAGGDTSVTVGSTVFTLAGGEVGSGAGGGSGGVVNPQANVTAVVLQVGDSGANGLSLLTSRGIAGGHGGTAQHGFGAGASSEFGAGGAGVSAGPTANTDGGNASGYGAGGAGALWLSGGAATAGNGSPGLLILEFVEGQ